MADDKPFSNKQMPPDQIEQRGVVQDLIVPVLQEAKPIAEGVLSAWAYDKLGQGKNPPPEKPPSESGS